MFDILKEKKTFLFGKMVQLLETAEGLSLEHAFDMHTRQPRALPSQPGAYRPSPKRGHSSSTWIGPGPGTRQLEPTPLA